MYTPAPRRPLCFLVAAWLGTAVAPAAAQPAETAADGEFSVQRFEPAPGPRNFLSVAGARTDGELAWSAGLMFDYQRDPFVITSCVTATDCSAANAQNTQDTVVVRDMLTWNLMGTLTPIPIVQLGLRVPVAFATGDGIDFTTGGPNATGLSGAGMGDLNLEGKFRVYGEVDDPIVIGAAADLSAPLGHATSEGNYIGNATPITGGIRAIFDAKPVEELSFAVNLRGVFKENATFGNTTLGPEFRWGVAAGYQPHELFRIIAESFGSTRFTTVNGTNSWEIDGGIQVMPVDGALVIAAAGGTGIIKGVGVPVGRAVVGLTFTYEGSHDEDGDGVPDERDRCPTDAEDQDGLEDHDGCPEDDVDHDKIPDDVDTCPEQPETENNFKDDDGCPDAPTDGDGDGIWDDQDKCPQAAGKMRRKEHYGCPDSDEDGVPDSKDECTTDKEDTDGFEDLDGCPDPDNDQDGVPDAADECGDEKEIMNGVADGDGCPDFGPDADADGIDDQRDECDDKAENLNGVDDGDGCPELSPTLAEVDPRKIALRRPLVFDGETITDAASLKALTALANGLNNWRAIQSVAVTVTVPGESPKLGEARAKAIVAVLVRKGVDAKRLVAKGQNGDAPATAFAVLKAPAWTP